MTDEDPFEKAARRDQEIKQRLRLLAKRRDNVLHDGSLRFLAVWGAVLAGQYFAFVLCALPFLWISLPTRDEQDPLDRPLSV